MVDDEVVFFNAHASGRANEEASPICGKAGWQAALPSTRILFIGDSDADFWVTEHFANSVNVAVGGYTCKDAQNYLADMLDAFKPEWVSIVCGENDLASGTSAAKTSERMAGIADDVVAAGAKMLIWGCKPEPDTKSLHKKYRDYDASLRSMAESRGGDVVFVDVYPAFEAIGNPYSLYQSDELHLSAEGYRLWDAWAKAAFADTTGCVIWQGGACTSGSGGGAPTPTTTTKASGGSGCAGHNKKTCKKQTCSCAWKKGTCAATNKRTCKKNKKKCVWKQPTCQVKEEFCVAFSTKSACKKQRKTCKWKKEKCLAK
jgi:lysophospholipase L1-like esterase